MNLVFDHECIKVYDDVLSDEDFEKVFDFFNRTSFFYPQTEGTWNHVWDVDTLVLKGQQFFFPVGKVPPEDEYHKPVIPIIKELNKVLNDGRVTMTPYFYAAGSGLSWHNDSQYKQAFTFYCHKHWSPEWGGELQTVELEEKDKNIVWKIFDNRELFDAIISKGLGMFFIPKPNRLIVNSNILHKINKTTANSGARLSLQGFIS